MLTRVGDRSAMFDGDIADENVMVYSLSYFYFLRPAIDRMMERLSFNMAGLLRPLLLFPAVLLLITTSSRSYAGVAVIGHDGLGTMDTTVVSRIFTGRTVQVDGIAVKPVNFKAGDTTRFFLRAVLQQSDELRLRCLLDRAAGHRQGHPAPGSGECPRNDPLHSFNSRLHWLYQ